MCEPTGKVVEYKNGTPVVAYRGSLTGGTPPDTVMLNVPTPVMVMLTQASGRTGFA